MKIIGRKMANYLEGNQEETSKNQDTPDSNVSQNAGSQGMSIDRDGTIPVQSNESPSQWPRDSWDMDEAWMSRVSEIQGAEIEEVDN